LPKRRECAARLNKAADTLAASYVLRMVMGILSKTGLKNREIKQKRSIVIQLN